MESNLHIIRHSMVAEAITTLRLPESSTAEFRAAIGVIARALAYEATRELPTMVLPIRTPIIETDSLRLNARVIALPILRAGLGLLHGFTETVPTALLGFIGLKRDEQTLQPRQYYHNIPDTAGSHLFILDPMLATGGSICATLRTIDLKGLASCSILSVIAAPEGVGTVHGEFPDVRIFLGALDERLNDDGYIVPGLGDAGDRICGTS